MTSSNLPPQTIRQYFKALTVLHFALVTGIVLFTIISFVLQNTGSFAGGDPALARLFLYIVPVLAVGCVIAGNNQYKKQVNEIKDLQGLADKLNAYRAAFIKRDALMEGPALFAIIAYLLTGQMLLLAIAALLIAAFLYFRPTKDTLIKDLELSTDETIIIQNDDAIIQ